MKTYLLLWNQERWDWETLEQNIEEVKLTGRSYQTWSCGNTKSIQDGDRVFLLKVGTEPKGIIASGFATSTPYTGEHWMNKNKTAHYINVNFDVLLNPGKEPILTHDILNSGNLSKQNWTPRSSGTSINSRLTEELEALWFKLFTNRTTVNGVQNIYMEGIPNQIAITIYERNPYARKKCLENHGYNCAVCGFNFKKTYGQIGKDFIHVHHLTQIATIGQAYQIDPIKDLRPVCPNCHSIIHKQKNPLTIEYVKQQIKENCGVN